MSRQKDGIMKIQFHIMKLNYRIIFDFLFIVLFLTGIFIYHHVDASNIEEIKLPIIMYHSVLKDKSQSGDYIVTPSLLEKDLMYIKNNNYHTIVMQDLIDYVERDIPLPSNPIIITFDDGHYNQYEYVYPLLEKYQMKAVISIVGSYTDQFSKTNEANPNYGYLRWCDINKMMESGFIEFQNHSYQLHEYSNNGRSGSTRKSGESLSHYKMIFQNDIQKLQTDFETNTRYIPTTFTYPFGLVSKHTTSFLKELGFKASLSCSTGINYIKKDPEDLFLLKRNNRPSNISTEDFFQKVLKE